MSVPRSFVWWCAVAVSFSAASAAQAQLVRGVVRSQTTARLVDRARVTAQDRGGRMLGEAITDEQGKFALRVDAKGEPFSIMIRRIGMSPANTDDLHLAPTDTVEYEFMVSETPVLGDTVRVTGMKSFNELRYEEAVRRGWKVFSPLEVAQHRDQVSNVYDLLRWAGASSLVIPGKVTECVRSARYMPGDRRNDRCMVWIVDGQVLGPTPVLNPADVYFMAILTGSESAIRWGDKAPWGAIVIYTRMSGDRLHP